MNDDWLKNKAIGIIILGAIGSIVASNFQWLVKYIIETNGLDWQTGIIVGAIVAVFIYLIVWLGNYIFEAVTHRRNKIGCLQTFAFKKLQSDNDVFKINIYYSFHSISLFMQLILSIIFFNLFFIILRVPNPEKNLLSLSVYIPIILAFLFLIGAYFEYGNLRKKYLTVMTPIFNEVIEKYRNNDRQE